MKILIFGLSGSGKTTLSEHIQTRLTEKGLKFVRINGNEIRSRYDDWDFSDEGRFRQADRIFAESNLHENVIIDFIAPFREIRKIINADYEIWMDTIQSSRYSDTDEIFERPFASEIDDRLISYPTNTTMDNIVHDIIEYYKELKFAQEIITD